jgi:hypothetical protein
MAHAMSVGAPPAASGLDQVRGDRAVSSTKKHPGWMSLPDVPPNSATHPGWVGRAADAWKASMGGTAPSTAGWSQALAARL